MSEKSYTIILADGTELANLWLNGDNFISTGMIGPDVFADNCSPVVISDGEQEERHDNMELVQITHNADGYWFVLRDIPQSEIEKIKMQSDIEYIAMMSDIEL